MGRKHKRSRFASDESVSSLPKRAKARKRKRERQKYSNRGSRTKQVRNKISLAKEANPNIKKVGKRIYRVVIPSGHQIAERFDLRNIIGFRTSRARNDRNKATCATAETPRKTRVLILPRSGIVETFDLRNVINFLSSKRRKARNKTPVVAVNSNILQELSRNSRVVIPPRRRIVERYRLRNVYCAFTSRTKIARNNTAPAITENRNIQQVRSENTRVQPTSQNMDSFDLRNKINFLTSRKGNAINNATPVITANPNIHHEQSRNIRVVVSPGTRIVERYRLLNVHGVLTSRMRNARNNTTLLITVNPNIQQIESKNGRPVIPPQIRIVERYKLRNVHSVLTSRTSELGNNTPPAVSDNPSTQQLQRRIPTAVVQPLNQIVVWPEHGNRFPRVRLATNRTSSSRTTNSHTQRIQRTSSNIEDRSQPEISEGYRYRNEHGFRNSSVRNATSDTPSAIAQDPDTQELLSRFPRINDLSMSENPDNYGYRNGDGLRVPRRRLSSRNPPMASAQDTNIRQSSRGSTNVDHWLLDESEDEYDSWTENGSRFSKFRNERDETSFLFAQDPYVKHKSKRSASREYNSLIESAEGYDCSICLDTRHHREMLYLKCLHKFHKRCINKWLNKYGMCPICRLSTEDNTDT